MKLVIIEEVRYEVEGDTAYDAMRAFMRDPNKHLTGVEERSEFIEAPAAGWPHRTRVPTDEEAKEIDCAESDS